MRTDLTPIQLRIFTKCLELVPKWNKAGDTLKDLIVLSDTEGDGFKRVTIVGKGTYLVPIEDIICKGIKGSEVPEKYQEE